MTRKLEFAPQYFSELLRFLREPSYHVGNLKDAAKDVGYSPWTAFATGTAIFASILAIDAARSHIHFDRIVLLTMLLVSAFGFALLFHGAARFAMAGKASFAQVLCGSEYLMGFLVPPLAGAVFLTTSLASLSPGLECSLGYFRIHDTMVPTTLNQVLITLVYLAAAGGTAYCLFRTFRFLMELESLPAWKTAVAMAAAGAVTVFGQTQLEVCSRLFSGQLQKLAKILAGS